MVLKQLYQQLNYQILKIRSEKSWGNPTFFREGERMKKITHTNVVINRIILATIDYGYANGPGSRCWLYSKC